MVCVCYCPDDVLVVIVLSRGPLNTHKGRPTSPLAKTTGSKVHDQRCETSVLEVLVAF